MLQCVGSQGDESTACGAARLLTSSEICVHVNNSIVHVVAVFEMQCQARSLHKVSGKALECVHRCMAGLRELRELPAQLFGSNT